MKFDGIIFGNGMTINLLEQLKPYIKEDKQYLIYIDDFLNRFIDGKISLKEENKIFNIFYKNKTIENLKYFEKLKYELRRYYLENDSNIEKVLGRDMFVGTNEEIGYDFKIIQNIFPALYNIWFNILYEYIIYLHLKEYVAKYCKSVKKILNNDENIFTTNFDYLVDEYLHPKHLHGRFIKNINEYTDVRLCDKNDDKEFYFKYIWGYNGFGKMNLINEINNLGTFINKYFDFDFFFNNNLKIKNLLIYGLSFQRSGFIKEEFLQCYPSYRQNLSLGTVIDEHIIFRIKGMQNLGLIEKIVISYHHENTKEYYKLLFDQYEIKNVVFAHTSNFDFSIYY